MKHPLCALLLAALCALPAAAGAQSLPPIYDKVPLRPAATSVVSEFGKGSFIENIALDAAGTLHVTSYLEGKVYRIDAQGRRTQWTSVEGTLAGIALNPDGSALLSGWIQGKEPATFIVEPDGRSRVAVRLPQGEFPNGVLRLGAGRYLVADSYKGVIWQVDTDAGSARAWLEDPLLARPAPGIPVPGANGIKRQGGAIYVSNTARQLLLKVALDGDRAAGKPEVVKEAIGLDDFDFDAQGNLYGATHVYNSLLRLAADGTMTVIAGLEQGMAGSTAVAVAKGPANALRLYVTTNGGMSLPPPGGVQSGKVLRVDLPPP